MGANGEYILEPISLKSLRVFFFFLFLFLSTVFRELSTMLPNGLGVFYCLYSIFRDGS